MYIINNTFNYRILSITLFVRVHTFVCSVFVGVGQDSQVSELNMNIVVIINCIYLAPSLSL